MRPQPKLQPHYREPAPQRVSIARDLPSQVAGAGDWSAFSMPRRAESRWLGLWRPLAIVASAALGFLGLLAGLYLLVGPVAAAIVAASVALLILWGNWILDHSIPL